MLKVFLVLQTFLATLIKVFHQSSSKVVSQTSAIPISAVLGHLRTGTTIRHHKWLLQSSKHQYYIKTRSTLYWNLVTLKVYHSLRPKMFGLRLRVPPVDCQKLSRSFQTLSWFSQSRQVGVSKDLQEWKVNRNKSTKRQFSDERSTPYNIVATSS